MLRATRAAHAEAAGNAEGRRLRRNSRRALARLAANAARGVVDLD